MTIDRRRRHRDQQSGLSVGHGDLAVAAQEGDDGGQHRGQALAGWGAGQHPADGETGHHVGAELRGSGRPRASDLERCRTGDGGPAVVPMPPGQLDQFVEYPRFLGPRSPLVARCQLLGHCLALPHRKLHDVRRNPPRHRPLGSPRSGGFYVRQRIGLRGGFR